MARRPIGAAGVAAYALITTGCGEKTESARSLGDVEGSAAGGSSEGGAVTVVAEAPPAQPSIPKWVIVKVGRVDVSERTRAGQVWDSAVTEDDHVATCGKISKLAAFLDVISFGLATAMSVVGCQVLFGKGDQGEQDPTAPDLVVRLVSSSVTYRSYVAFDQRSHLFNAEFLVPIGAIDREGIVLEIVDADGDGGTGTLIGSTRVTRERLLALSAGQGEADLHEANDLVSRLEVSVRVDGGEAAYEQRSFDVSKGGVAVAGYPIAAGQRVKIKASGTYQIGVFQDALIGPTGHSSASRGTDNLDYEAFRELNHGAVVGVIGARDAVFTVPVTPCSQFIAPFAGTLWVGVNDRGFDDNRGRVDIRLARRPPTLAQWSTPGAALDCE